MIETVVYYLALGFARLVCWLPLSTALALGRNVSAFGYHVLRFRRGVVLGNLRHVFGAQRSESELRELAAESYRQFGMNTAEVVRGLYLPGEAAELVEIPDIERLRAMQAAGEPLILCCPHAGSFDRLGAAAAAQGIEIHAMMTPAKSRRFNELLVTSRERAGMHILVRGEESFYELMELLEQGKTVALLPDQNARRGVTVDFLGQPAATFGGPASLHLITGARIAVIIARRRRDDPLRHTAELRFLPDHVSSGERKRDIREITQRICDVMSELILEEPAQYFWLHRRWGKRLVRAEPEPAHGRLGAPGAC